MGVENNLNAYRALDYAQRKFQLNPLLVTSDFSPNLIVPICQVFGEKVLQIDGYHVMQELNNGIRRDVLDFRNRFFQAEIHDFYALRNWINFAQCDFKRTRIVSDTTLGAVPAIDVSHHGSYRCFTVAQIFVDLVNVVDPAIFSIRVDQALKDLEDGSNTDFSSFCGKLREKMPKRSLTLKGMNRLKGEVLKKLKTSFLPFRATFEEESKCFYRDHWAIFFQPERLTVARSHRLEEFLTEYPELHEYREMTLLVGEIYRKEVNEIDGHQIDDLIAHPRYSKKLQTAITTLKKYKSSILRFVEVFKDDPSLAKGCRANMEYRNRRFKAPFKSGLGCTQRDHLTSKLSLQMGCEVRFFLEEGALA